METYNGHVRSPADAIILFEACRLGLLPRVQRRLSEKERSQIKSGSVFVWDEREAGMRRWTDGKSWSASRVSGSFLTYREMEGKRGNSGFPPGAARSKSNGPKSANGSQNGESDDGDEGPDGYRYKPDGLMKQSFSITTQDGRHLHLISYYNRSQIPPLKNPTNDPQLRNIQPPKSMYPENTVNEPTTMAPIVRPAAMVSPPFAAHPGHAPAGMIVAYPWYPAAGGYAYSPAPWPPSPSATPPTHYAYPPPGYVHAAYAQPHLPPYPHHVQQHPFERAPPTPQNPLPPPQAAANGPASPNGWQQIPSPGAPPYHNPQPAIHPSPYSASHAPQPGPVLAPVTSVYKPPSPPTSDAPQQAPSKPYSEPPPLKDIPASTTSSIIPSINALINGPPPEQRAKSRSPPLIKGLPNAMAASGLQRDRGDLKKLDSQLLKGKS